jgi:aldehyde dehydrogenase (NAD+)
VAPADQAPARYPGFDRMPIAGTWRAGGVGSTASDLNPFTGETLVEIPQADAADVDSAYRGARDAQRQWERTPPSEQAQVFLRAAQIMDARREEIFDWLTVEAGSTRVKCEWEWTLKPASDTPVTGALLLAKIYEEAGLPMSLLSVIVGRGREVGDPLITHPVPRLISFTGSTEIGKGIAEKAGIKKLDLELGGNAPVVVLDDADLDHALDTAVFSSYLYQGQICIRANRVIVDAAVHDDFVARFVERARALRVGDPKDPETRIGPITNAGQLKSIQDKVSRSVDAGAQLLLSGEPTGPAGLALPPHVVSGRNDVPTAAEEVFGPVATIVRADGESDALELANQTRYGLSSSVFTQDFDRGLRFAHQVQAGMTHINDTTVNYEPNTAFGGEKDSGAGRFGGDWGIETLTTDHWISVQHSPRRFDF